MVKKSRTAKPMGVISTFSTEMNRTDVFLITVRQMIAPWGERQAGALGGPNGHANIGKM
jgi:hypothetical protein